MKQLSLLIAFTIATMGGMYAQQKPQTTQTSTEKPATPKPVTVSPAKGSTTKDDRSAEKSSSGKSIGGFLKSIPFRKTKARDVDTKGRPASGVN